MKATPSDLEIFLRTVVARAYPRVVGLNRQRSWLFFDLGFPLNRRPEDKSLQFWFGFGQIF